MGMLVNNVAGAISKTSATVVLGLSDGNARWRGVDQGAV
jgi:hypothetical protein